MKDILLLASVLISIFCSLIKCEVYMEITETNGNCTFVLSNGGYEEFLAAIPLFENCTKQFTKPTLQVNLINYNLPAFPNKTFTNLPSLKSFTLKIFKRSQIQLLSPCLPHYSVFENLKFEKAVIDVSDSPNLNGWKWKILSEIQYRSIRRFEFIAIRSKLIRLDGSFGKIAGGQVTTVRILNCQLRWLGENVFGPFSNLMNLELRKNFLDKFERSHLPNDASKLQYLDLGINKLRYLLKDIFHGLKLKRLFMDGNNIKLLDSQINSITAMDTLTDIYGILWPCDCSRLKRLSERITNLSAEKCYKDDFGVETIQIFLSSCK